MASTPSKPTAVRTAVKPKAKAKPKVKSKPKVKTTTKTVRGKKRPRTSAPSKNTKPRKKPKSKPVPHVDPVYWTAGCLHIRDALAMEQTLRSSGIDVRYRTRPKGGAHCAKGWGWINDMDNFTVYSVPKKDAETFRGLVTGYGSTLERITLDDRRRVCGVSC